MLVPLTFSGCGGGGGSGRSGGGPDITQQPPTQQPGGTPPPGGNPGTGGGNPQVVPPPPTTVVVQPTQPVHDFSTCYYEVTRRPDTECFGGAPGFKELRDVALATSNTITLVIDGGSGATHQRQVWAVATIHNMGVGGSVVLTGYANGHLLSNDLRNGVFGDPDIISSSTKICIGRNSPSRSCFDETLFDDPDEPIVVSGTGNIPTENALDHLFRSGDTTLFLKTEIDKGHWLWAYGLNRAGDDIHSQSSSCHILIKDYCIGAPFNVASGGGSVDANGVYSQIGYNSGTSNSAPIVAVALKLLKEADPTIENTELIRIACESATDLGPTGNDATYGCGALNLVGLFDQFGNFVGAAAFPGISPAKSFNTAVVDPNTNYPSTDLLTDGGSKSHSFAFAYDRETDSASMCMQFLCVFYSDENKSLQKGLLFSTENAYAGVFAEKKDNDFFGGSGSKGSRSDYNEVDYIKGSAGWQTELEPYDISIRFDIAKGSAEGGGRIDHLDGIQNKFAITAARSFGYNSNVSFSAGLSNFAGSAGISGSDHDLNHDEIKFDIQFGYEF